MATHSSILACEIPWTEEEPGGLQSIGLQESDTTGRLNHHHGNLHPKTFSKMFRITLRKAVLIDTATSQHPLGIFIFKQTRASTSGRMHTTCDGTGGFCLLSGHRHTLGWPPGDTTAQPASVQDVSLPHFTDEINKTLLKNMCLVNLVESGSNPDPLIHP